MTGKLALIVDDNPKILILIKKITQHYLRLPCETYSNPLEAIRAFTDNPAKYNIIVSDYQMPYLNGIELCKSIKMVNANIPCILISGAGCHVNTEKNKEFMEKHDIPFIEKPFLIPEFNGLIKATIS